MSGLFGILDVATRGLLVTQSGIRVTSHNTANVETPGYTRQRQVLQAGAPIAHPAGAVGTGVEQRSIERVDDALLFRQLYDADARNAALGIESNGLSRIEELLNEQQEEGLGARLARLYDSFDDLASATTPGAPVERESLRGSAQAVADAFHGLDADLRRLMTDSDRSAVGLLGEINGIAREIAELNDAIMREEAVAPANDLRDRRDALVRRLAEQVDVSTFEQPNGGLVVMIADGLALVDGATARQLIAEPDPANPIDPRFSRIQFDLGTSRVDVTGQIGGGALGGHLEVRDAIAPAALRELDALAYNLAVQTNAVHAAGVGLDGSSGGFFAALGAVEDAARLLALDPAILASTDAIAAGLSTDPGDNRNALALAALRDTPTSFYRPGDPPGPPTGALRTVLDAHAVLIGEVGESARNARSAAEGQQLALDALQARRDAISGVSLDEEMVRLIRLEAAYQANARVISTLQTMLDSLVGLVV